MEQARPGVSGNSVPSLQSVREFAQADMFQIKHGHGEEWSPANAGNAVTKTVAKTGW